MSRFLRFFRIFTVIIACAFSALSAQAHYVQLIDGDYATSGSVPSQFNYISSNYPVGTQVLTSFPYRPGYGYGGHWTGPNCSGSKKIDHEGKIAASIPSSTMRLYACWKNILGYSGLYGNYSPRSVLLFDYNGGAEPLFGNWLSWSACNGLIGDMGVRFENKGDFAVAPNIGTKWIHLEGCSWMYVGGTFEQYFSFAPYELPTRQGYAFDGFYKNQDGTGYAVGWFQNGIYFLHTPATVATELPLPDNQFVSVYAKWVPNVYQVNLATGGSYGSGATPNPVYLRYGEGWYDTLAHAEAGGNTGKLTNLTTAPSNGDLEFKGFYLGQGGTGQQITVGSQFLTSALTAITQNNMTIYPYWGNPTTWATLEIDDQGATTSSGYNVGSTWYSLEDVKLYSAVTGDYCMGGYRREPNCISGSINSVTKPVKDGWVFGGYYTAINGGGEPFGTDGGNNIWNFPSDGITQDTTIYAKWTTEYYPITLLNGSQSYTIYEKYNDGWYRKDGNQYVEITTSIFEDVNSGGAGLTRPNGNGEFTGYYDAQGRRVISYTGVIVAGPIYDAPTTFTAQFSGIAPVEIKLNIGDNASWGECNQRSITVVPGGEFPVLECGPTMTGYDFNGYIAGETLYYGGFYPQMSVVPDNPPQDLYAKWSPVVNKLEYTCDGVGVHGVQVTYNDPYVVWNGSGGISGNCQSVSASSTNAGRKLFGWDVKESPNAIYAMRYRVGQEVDHWLFWSRAQYAYSVFKPIYYVTLDHNGAENTPSPNFVYFSDGKWYRDNLATDQITHMDVEPMRRGYDFMGYSTANTDVGAFNEGNFIESNTQLSAKWNLKKYNISLNQGGGDYGGTRTLYYRIDKGWYTNGAFEGQPATRIIKPASTPSDKVFGGYYTAPNGGGERAIDADGNILYTGTGADSGAMNLIQLLGSDQTLYIKWDDEAHVPEGENEKFIVHTTSMSANARFAFSMSAAGDFYVQWDANDDSTIQHIVRDNTNLTPYEHTYSAAAPDGRDIVIWGTPTGYNGGSGHIGSSVITFAEGSGTPLLVAGVSGSLGGVFRTIGDGAANWKNPSFYWTFFGCSNLDSLPENLFGYTKNGNYVGVTGSRPYMFAGTFENTGLTSIPGNLFGRMVSGTYNGVSGAADYMFAATFALTNLNTDSYPIPGNLFAGVTGNAEGLFAAMFEGCSNLKTVPSNLFINVSGAAKGMFGSTFMASGLTSLPGGLFSGVTGTAESIFYQTFSYCSGLAGKYIPKDLFNLGDLTYNASNNMMASVFDGTNLATSCDSFHLTHYQTDYDNTYWEGKVICAPAAVFSCENPSVGGTPNGTLTTIWADQITSSTTLPAATNCTAPTHYTKPSTAYWACTGNSNCTGNPNHWAAGGSKPSWLTNGLTQSVNFYMEYTPNVYTIVLNQNHSSNDNTTVSGSPIKERYGDAWLDSNGVVLDPQKAPVPSSWTSNNTTYNFKGYFTLRSGGTRMTTNDGTFVNDAATHTVGSDGTWYAQWDDSNNVTFKCEEGGSAINGYSFTNVQNGDSINVPATSVCTKTGYTFTQWKIVANGVLINETNNGGTYTWNYNFGSDVVPDWQPVQTTITLDTNGGTWGNNVPNDGKSVYTIWGTGVYRDAARTEKMEIYNNPWSYVSGSQNNTVSNSVTLTYDLGANDATFTSGGQTYTGSVSFQFPLGFTGFYAGETQMIKGRVKIDGQEENLPGYITYAGLNENTGGPSYTTPQTWYAHWSPITFAPPLTVNVPVRRGYVFLGWYTAANGGDQIADGNGNLDCDDCVIQTVGANTTWYAHWTECSHDFGSNPNASKEPLAAVDGMCRYHITCDTDPGVPLGAGYSQYGGTNATGEFDFTISPSSTDDLPGCSARVYNIEYHNVEEHGGTMPSGDWYTYTYGVSKTINMEPTSPTEVFDSWCDDLNNASTCSATKTIGATDYGDKIYYAKWDDECKRGYERLTHDVMMSQVYDDNDSWHWAVPNYTTWYLSAGTCVPKIYHVRCNKNCGDDTCAACLEDFVMDGYNWHLGGGYNVKDFCFESSGFTSWVLGGLVPVRARVSGDPENNNTNVFYNCTNGTGIEPNYIWLNSYYIAGGQSPMLSRMYSTVGDYDTGNYNHLLQSLSGNTNSPSREHYTFGGLWTAPTGGKQYIDANGNFVKGDGTAYNKVPWPSYLYNNYDARAFQNFFFDNNIAESLSPVSGGGRTFDVYAHWIPDVYTITLNKNADDAESGNLYEIKEKWGETWSRDFGANWSTSNDFTIGVVSGYNDGRPTRNGYTFMGYYTERQTGTTCPGTQIIKDDGTLNTEATSQYGAVGNAKYFGANGSTLYACWNRVQTTITLDNANATTNGTASLTSEYGVGAYLNVNGTPTLMTTDGPAITLPQHNGYTVSFDMNYTGATGPAAQTVSWLFNGYFDSVNGSRMFIDSDGKITSTGAGSQYGASGYTTDQTWYAQWTEQSTIELPSVYNPAAGYFGRPNHLFNGWWTAANGGTKAGDSGDEYTPSANTTLHAHWDECSYIGGANGTVVPRGTSGVGDDNSCIYTLTCNTNYACPNGDTTCAIYGEANNPVVTIPDCVAVAYTITYKDVDNTELHTQGYSYSTDPITLWTPDSDVLAAHHASSVTWCANADGTNCETDNQIGPGATGDKVFFAKWTCATGYSLDSNGVCAYSKYDVTYDCGAAGGQHTYSNSATFNSSYTVKTLAQAECPTTLAGYTFNGWHVEPANDDWNAGDTFTWEYTANQTFAAQWEPNKYRVILNKNASDAVVGNVGEIWEKWNNGWALTQDGTYNSTMTLSGNQLPTRTGYTFAGYFDTNAETGGNAMGSVSNGVWTTPPATAVDVNPTTWYARWLGNQYTVTYNCGIGTGDGSVDNTPRYGQSYTPKTYTAAGCERPSNGYYFDGWNVAPGHSNSDIKNAGEAFGWDYTENQTFTARWVAKEYHITFSKNGGSDGTNEVWERYDSFWHDAGQNHIITITLPNWSGHTFAGYAFNGNTVISGATLPAPTLYFGDTSNNSTVDITLVAQWDTNTYNVQYNLGGGTTTLPVGYVPVEYITFDGNQVIDTELTIKKGYEIQTKFYPTDTGKYVYGVLSSGNSRSVTGYVSTSGDNNWRWGNKAMGKVMSLNDIYTIVQNANALTVNGVPVAYETQNDFETDVSLSIGKAHSASGGNNYDTSGFQGRMYWFTIRDDNGNIVYHGVPVKNTASGQYGLCNIVDGTCLTASGINGATATLPATYNHGTATTVSGAAARANSVFNSWCSSPSSNCNSAQTIPATATGDKTFYAKWTCDAGYSYSSGGACVANNITLDWNENGGIGLTNGSCTYNGDLTLAGAPTYANHVFNGWKLANNTYGGASTTVNGGCVQAYTGVTSGTSTAITAKWCPACNPTHATCTLDATTPGTCSYTTSCESEFYHYVSGENTYNPVCEPYKITYQSTDTDGVSHGSGAVQEILSNPFTTNDAKNSSQFSWNNHIVTAWTRVSGGNFPNLDTEYPYNVQSDTVLKANWGECHCTAGTGATSCDTISSNNACEVNVIVCDTGFTGSTWSCDGINCTATCNNDNRHTITLNKNNGTGGTTTLYTISGTGSDAGVYINSARTEQYRMIPNPNGTNPIVAPTLSRAVSYDITSNGNVTGASFAQQPTSANTSAVATFNGYYISETGTERYIEEDGYINTTGVSNGKGYTTDKTWYAQWTYGSVTLPIAYRPGYTLSGWSTTVGGTSVGNAGDSYTTGSDVTLYPVWTQCEAGEYCPGVETVNNQTVYNVVHNCPTNYPNSAVGSTMISDCYLILTAGKWVETAGSGMVNCTQNYYCDDDTTKVYYSDPGDGRRTTGIRKSCATNAGSFSLTDGTGKTSINACYKNVTLNKRGGSGTVGGASNTNDGSTSCSYNQNCTLPDASILQLTGYTFHGGWTDQPDTDCNSTTRIFVVPDDVDTYYACRTTNSYEVTLADGLNTNTVLGTIRPTYGAAMPSVDSNGNPLTVPTKNASHTTYIFEGYYDAQQNGTTATQYYDYNLNSTNVWNKTGNEDVLYARWSVTCDPGYYLPANATSCTTLCPAGRYCAGNTTFTSFDVPKSSNQGLSGYIAAGYYSTGGASTSTPSGHVTTGNGCYGQVSGADTACGIVAGGYYSTGGGTSATPTAAGNGCLSGSGRSCGKVSGTYFSNGGGKTSIPTATGCVTGQFCGRCPETYRSNTTKGKANITECVAACASGTQVATAEDPTMNNAEAIGCTTPNNNNWWSNAHDVNYGSASPTVTSVIENGVHMCATNYYTPNTSVVNDHNAREDCTRTVTLDKNGGATIDGAVWPDGVADTGGTANASVGCAEGILCDFGNPANLLEQAGYTFQANWGADDGCSSTVGTSVTTPQLPRYYACKVQNNYTLTYACGTGVTGDAPSQQTNIHYGDTVSVSGAGNCAKTGHSFVGWAVSGTNDTITATTWPRDITWNYEESKTFTAQWTADIYDINYDENGGTRAEPSNAYPTQYTYGFGATVTGGATRANSVFQGWCETEDSSGVLSDCQTIPFVIGTNAMGEKTLHAKWGCATGYHNVDNQCVANEFTLVYSKNGHGTQNTPANQTCTYGQQINLAAALSETGWNFNGWTIAGENYAGGVPIICNERYLGVTGGATRTTVNVTADWSAACNKITLNKNSNSASWTTGSVTALYAKTRENSGTVDSKWYKDDTCTTEYASADYENIKPIRSGWAFRGFYVNQEPDAADISATQTNGVEQHIDYTGAPTSTGQTFINGLNAPATLYAGWARDCTDPVAHGTCERTIGQNTTYTTSCVAGYHYDPAASESTYNPICVPNTITIILDKNGGTGTCGGQSGTESGTLTCNYDGTCNTPVWGNTCALSKTGKVFAGWNTAADGTGTQYGSATVAGDVQNMNDGTTSTTLYAVWEDAGCNVANGSAAVSVSDNTVTCDVTCNNGYGSNGIYTGQQHATSVTTGQCNEGTYDIRYHYDAEHGGALASLLPEGYTQLEYVTANGRQYFDTGVVLTNTSNIENVMEIQATSFSGFQTWTGFMKTSGTTPRYGINFYSNKWMIGINATSSNGVTADSGRHIVKFVTTNNAQILYDTDGTTELARSSLDANALSGNVLPLYIGARNNSGTPVNFVNGNIGRIYLKQNGVELYHYIPVQRDEDDVVGFYDTVSGEFLRSATANDFVAGPVVTVEYPESYTYGTGATVYGGATRANSVFEGWCRNAALTDGCTMVPYVIGTTEYDDKDLYAKWSCVNGYHLDGNNQCVGNTITINYQNGGHGGIVPNDVTRAYGASLTLADAMYAIGYDFIGWKVNGVTYYAGDSITLNYDTLGAYSGIVPAVAQWDNSDYTIKYNCNTSWTPNYPPADGHVSTGDAFTPATNTCVNPGYSFVGWRAEGESNNWVPGTIWPETSVNPVTFYAQWERDNTSAFTVTVDMPANTEFKFTTIATGQFWVDWDDGSNIEEYAPTTITTKTWTHTYTTAGTYVIKIGGRATGYAVSGDGTPEKKSAISFFNGTLDGTGFDATVETDGTEQYITEVSGKLGAIFPTITAGSWGGQPRFYRTFKNTTAMDDIELQSIADLFDGISGTPVPYMFAETFDGSAVTGAIPAGLFPVSGAPKTALFMSTFRNCTGLTGTIPANLFVNISGTPAVSMFSRTFRGCTGLTGIPAGLFRNISGAPAEAMFWATFLGCTNITGTLSSNLFGSLNGPIAKDMFRSTFYNCTSLVGDASDSTVAIPNGLFGTLTASTTAATYAFYYTFYGCSALSGTIGGALFGGLTGNPAEYMFDGTFYGCSNLNGSIPQNLFGNMTGAPKQYMFFETFRGDSGLSGSIPDYLFGHITGRPASNMFKGTFHGCSGLTGIIPANLFAGISGKPAASMFQATFNGCSNLGGIGGALFSGISGGPMATSMFYTTFSGCSGLRGSIPDNMFGTPSGAPAGYMFGSTFNGCSGLTGEIPSGLFGTPNGPAAQYMFYQTFKGCSGLTGTIPSGLFGTLSEAGKTYMFYHTFQGCSNLSGYVPEGLFGTMTKPSSVPTGMMSYVFADSGLLTECPCGTEDVSQDSPFYTYWRSTSDSANPKKVSCRVDTTPGNYYWYNGQCTTACSDTAIDELYVGNLDPYVVLADPVSTVKNLAIKHNDTICYVPVASGNGGASSLNMKYGNTVYHADRPNDTPPAGFGQR